LLSAAVGVSFMQFTNKNSIRNIYIIGLALFLGISIPQYFSEYTSSADRGPARTNAGWVYFAFPFRLHISYICIFLCMYFDIYTIFVIAVQ
jgi:glycerol uptake facilitator-like aquaporin